MDLFGTCSWRRFILLAGINSLYVDLHSGVEPGEMLFIYTGRSAAIATVQSCLGSHIFEIFSVQHVCHLYQTVPNSRHPKSSGSYYVFTSSSALFPELHMYRLCCKYWARPSLFDMNSFISSTDLLFCMYPKTES